MSFSAKNYLETIYQNNIFLFCNMPYHIFFYKVDTILTRHLHAFPNNTLLILFQKNIWGRDGHLKIISLGGGYIRHLHIDVVGVRCPFLVVQEKSEALPQER